MDSGALHCTLPPQCPARLYIIGSRLTRSHFRATVGSINALSLATNDSLILPELVANSSARAPLIGHVPFPATKHRSPSQPVRGVPLTLALQLDPIHGIGVVDERQRKVSTSAAPTKSGYLFKLGSRWVSFFGITVVRIDSRIGRILTRRGLAKFELTHYAEINGETSIRFLVA